MKVLLAVLAQPTKIDQAHADQVLRVYSLKDFLTPQVPKQFQQQTNIAADYQTYTSNDEPRQALSIDLFYELTTPGHSMLEQLIGEQRPIPLEPPQLIPYSDDPWLLTLLTGLPEATRHAAPYLCSSSGLVITPRPGANQLRRRSAPGAGVVGRLTTAQPSARRCTYLKVQDPR